MPTNSLTDHKCKSAKPKDKPYKLFDGHGLYLYVAPTGSKLWRMAFRVEGKPQTSSFGPYPLLTLAEARVKRDALRAALLNGEPVKEQKPKPTLTVEQSCESFWSGRADVSDNYRMNALHAMQRHVYPVLGAKPIGDVDRAMVLDALSRMNAAGLLVYVRRVRVWLGQVFDWAVEHGHCATNPCSAIDPKKAFSKAKVESFAALTLPEIKPFMARLELEGVIQSAIACRLLALTGVRTNELRCMEWSEIDGDLWRIPAARMKKGNDHLVPLSRQALALIEHMRARSKGSKYVFPNDRRIDRPMSENAILYLIGRMGYAGKMTGHGWRSVLSTWANEAGFDKDAIERQLAHVPANRVRGIYNRAEFLPVRRAMLQAWADWLLPEVQPALAYDGASSASSVSV